MTTQATGFHITEVDPAMNGSSERLEDSGIVVSHVRVTPELATEWLAKHNFSKQRPLRDYHVDFLAFEMQHGRFGVSYLRFAVLPDGSRWLVDGQHRLNAVVRAGRPVDFLVTYEQVPTLLAAQALYAQIDQGLKRSTKDTLTALGVSESVGLTPTQVQWVGAAVVHLQTGFRSHPYREASVLSIAERVALIEEWSEDAHSYFQATQGASKGFAAVLKNSPVLAVGLATIRYSREKAWTFWGRMADDDGLKRGEPEHTINRWLHDNSMRRMGFGYYSRAVAQAWNAYYEGRRLSIIKPSINKPVIILGTPYDGSDQRPAEQG